MKKHGACVLTGRIVYDTPIIAYVSRLRIRKRVRHGIELSEFRSPFNREANTPSSVATVPGAASGGAIPAIAFLAWLNIAAVKSLFVYAVVKNAVPNSLYKLNPSILLVNAFHSVASKLKFASFVLAVVQAKSSGRVQNVFSPAVYHLPFAAACAPP